LATTTQGFIQMLSRYQVEPRRYSGNDATKVLGECWRHTRLYRAKHPAFEHTQTGTWPFFWSRVPAKTYIN